MLSGWAGHAVEQLDAEKNCEESGGGGAFFSCLFVCVEMLYLFVILKKKAFLDYSWEGADGAVAGLQLLGCKFQATNDFQ